MGVISLSIVAIALKAQSSSGFLIPDCSIRVVIANGVLCGNGSGLWGSHCRSLAINKENCALRCVSHSCYDSVYGNDHVSLTPCFPLPSHECMLFVL